MKHGAAELSRMLAVRAHELAQHLFPAGRRDGHEWRVGSLAGEKGQSLAVHLGGARAGVWCDFSSGDRGDGLDLVAHALFGGDRREAMVWARSWLGLSEAAPGQTRRPPAPVKADEVDHDAMRRRAAAMGIWTDVPAGLRSTPVADYLAGRGIDLAELGRAPGALRFHPNLWNQESGSEWPAMIAAICAPDGALVAVHRTWLAYDEGRWVKAPLADPKRTLGSYAGGCIRIWRGASACPLAEAPEGEAVVLAEGIETALSVAIACPELRVLCAVSLANMGRVVLPPAIGTVTIAADNDEGNPSAQRALETACRRFLSEGRTVRLSIPKNQGQDWNDVLQSGEQA